MKFRVLVLFLLGGLLVSTDALSQDRSGLFGQSISLPYRLTPRQGRGDETYSLDLGYFFDEHWLGVLSWEFGLRGAERAGIGVGPNYLMRLYSDFKPFVGAKFLYSVDPTNEIGWRVLLGLEINPKRLTKVDNLRLTLETGVSGFLFDAGPNEYNVDIARIGLSWSY